MSEWIDFDPECFEDAEVDREGYWTLTSRAPVDEWKCTECGDLLGWLSNDEGGGWWVPPFCPTQEFDEATMRCEDCVPEDDPEVEVGCAVCGEVGLPIIGHADTCRGPA